MNTTFAKPLVMGGIAMAVDQLYLKETDLNKSIMFGGAVAVGNYASEWVTPIVKAIDIKSFNKDLYDTKTLVERIAEVGTGSAVIYVLNKYVLNNDNYAGEMMLRLGIIAFSDITATYALEYINGEKLEFLTNE